MDDFKQTDLQSFEIELNDHSTYSKKLLPKKCRPTLSLDFSQITLCKTVKYLGVTIDDSIA